MRYLFIFMFVFMIFSSNVFAEVKNVDCNVNTMVMFGISESYTDKLKKEKGEDAFFTIADDQNYYENLAYEYADKNNINTVFVDLYEIDTVVFKAKNKEVKVSTKDNDWTVWYCNGKKQPEKSTMIDSVENAKKYFSF